MWNKMAYHSINSNSSGKKKEFSSIYTVPNSSTMNIASEMLNSTIRQHSQRAKRKLALPGHCLIQVLRYIALVFILCQALYLGVASCPANIISMPPKRTRTPRVCKKELIFPAFVIRIRSMRDREMRTFSRMDQKSCFVFF